MSEEEPKRKRRNNWAFVLGCFGGWLLFSVLARVIGVEYGFGQGGVAVFAWFVGFAFTWYTGREVERSWVERKK